VAAIGYRLAALGDAAEIFDLLKALAHEIPLLLDTLEREEALYAAIRNCARSGESWVATDEAGRIAGCALVEPAQARRHYAEHEVLELRYAGVAPALRGGGVFAALIGRVLARMLPVSATVSRQNRSGAAARLEGLGFRRTEGGEPRYRWLPGGKLAPRSQNRQL